MSARLRSLLASATVLTPAVVAATAEHAAAYNQGVAHVTYDSVPVPECDGGALPPAYGGSAECDDATIYVTQSLGDDGEWHYDDVVGTSGSGTNAVFPISLSSECRSGYRFLRASLELGEDDSDGNSYFDPEEVTEWWGQPVEVNTDNKTMPTRWFDMVVPIEFLDLGDLAALGEDELQDRLEDHGTPIAVSRANSWTRSYWIDSHARVECKGIGPRGAERYMNDSATSLLQVVFLAPGQEAGPGWRDAVLPEPPFRRPGQAGGLVFQTQVTQAHLSVLPDPDDSCRLNLSGTVVTNGPTELEYRFVDQLGVRSQSFTAQVDHTHTVMLDHHVMLAAPTGGTHGGAPGQLVGSGGGGSFGGDLTTQDTDRVQGYFQLEIVEPHHLLSPVADYNVPPCVPEVDTTLDVPIGDLTRTTRN